MGAIKLFFAETVEAMEALFTNSHFELNEKFDDFITEQMKTYPYEVIECVLMKIAAKTYLAGEYLTMAKEVEQNADEFYQKGRVSSEVQKLKKYKKEKKWDGKTDSGSEYFRLRQKGHSHKDAVDICTGVIDEFPIIKGVITVDEIRKTKLREPNLKRYGGRK